MATNREKLIRIAQRILASRADAEDAVQDTYVRALVSCPDRRHVQPAWLHAVLRNIAIDRLRRKRWEAESDTELPTEESLESLLEIRSECEAALRLLLSHVSPAEATAILLCDVFEFDYDDIARILGKSNSAARQFLHRARTRAHRADSSTDADETYVEWCWRAIEARDPTLLMDMLQATLVASAQQTAIADARDRRARSSSKLVQINGRYAIALVLDGIVLCIVPVGTQTTSMSEPA
jgi:RNA polymerase sigma factor (sigma-70 family)